MPDPLDRTPARPVRAAPPSGPADARTLLREEFAGVASETLQLRELLADATRQLVGPFHALRKGSAELAHRLERSPRASEFPELAALARATAGHSDPIVMGLQFEDVACQLLSHIDRRLAGIEALTIAIVSRESAGAGSVSGAGADPPVGAAPVDVTHDALEELRRSRPRQHGLEGGDVELF